MWSAHTRLATERGIWFWLLSIAGFTDKTLKAKPSGGSSVSLQVGKTLFTPSPIWRAHKLGLPRVSRGTACSGVHHGAAQTRAELSQPWRATMAGFESGEGKAV